MKNRALLSILPLLQVAACIVIIMAGIRAAADILGPLILAFVLAQAVLPFPRWLMRRFKISKGKAIALTGVTAVVMVLYLLVASDVATVHLSLKLPVYEQHLASLYEQTVAFMNAHNIAVPELTVKTALTPERFREIARVLLPEAGAIISNGLLITLLGFIFVMQMTQDIGEVPSSFTQRMTDYGSDARRYVAVTAKVAGINALVNLVFLFVLGVDTPVIWCFLYFFLDFIPTLGYIIALIPPTFVTLLMFGWKRALIVAGGLVLTNVIVDNVVTPIFMKSAVDVSFLELTLSLIGWAFVLGLIGAIVAVPMTLALKKFLATRSGVTPSPGSEHLAPEPSG
jgi:AI-2 transport protein TqsA